jgi:Bacterial Ig-like domain
MRFSKYIPYFFILGFIAVNLLSGSGCANIVPPSGGPRDSLPPVPVSFNPKDSGLRVTTQKIVINFDEFVELKNANENILISPYPNRQPETEVKLRSVNLKLKDSLLPNTTYVIDFGNSIADINEGNLLKNFRYVFSTGNSIDSNELRGRITIAETGKTDSTFFALLYRTQQDSTVVKEKPVYVTRVDSKGFFQFYNLPTGTFYVYALQDADGDKRYNQPSEAFAFADSPVNVNAFTRSVQLYAYTAEVRKKTTPPPAEKPGSAKRLIYTTNLEGSAQDLMDSLKFSYQKPLKSVDTSQIQLFKDSTTPVTNATIRYDTSNKKIIVFTQWQEGANYVLILNKEYASDTSGVKPLKNDTIGFRVKGVKEYGSVRLRFKNLDLSKNPVMLFYLGEQLVGSYPLSTTEWLQQLYKPGEYEVRFLFDANKNGVWDPGNYFSKPRLQPERVQNQGAKINIKPNWDNESTIDLGTQQ